MTAPYASQSDVQAALGLPTLVELTDRAEPKSDEVDQDVVERALIDASASVNAYIGKVVNLPLSSVPPLVKSLTRDLAIHQLHSHLHTVPDSVQQRHDEAMRQLRDIATGTASLGLKANGQEEQASSVNVAVVSSPTGGSLTPTALDDYASGN